MENETNGSRNVAFLLIILFAAIAMAIAFLPSVNSNIQASMNAINGAKPQVSIPFSI